MSFWILFTKLADTTVLMPLAFALAGWLAYVKRWRAAVYWLFLFCAGLGVVAASKVAYVGWGIGVASIDFKGFSGHAMRATAVMPVLSYLLLQTRKTSAILVTLSAAFGFSIAIAISRLVLHEHSMSEVIGGLILGGAIGVGFLASNQARRIMPLNKGIVALLIFIAIPGTLAKPAPTEYWIENVALYLSGHEQPYRHQYDSDRAKPQ